MILQEEETSWFLAQLKPNCAQVADRNLKRQGFRTFLPMEAGTRQRQGRFVTRLQPLFPGYIFVAFDVAKGFWRSVNSTHGVSRLVSLGKEPTAVPGELMVQLMQRCDPSGKLRSPVELKPGDQVRPNRGPFTDIIGEIEKTAPDHRVWVLMNIMGGAKRVAMDAGQLRLT